MSRRRLPRQTKAPQAASDINAAYHVSGADAPGPGERRQRVTASGNFEASTFDGMRIAAGGTGGVTVNGPELEYWGDASLTDLNLRRIGETFNLPAIATDFSPVPSLSNPLGIKGVGEGGTVAATPTVMNAILDALAPLGVAHIDMPATPQRVWQAIQGARRT
jgi:hypothetical protein